MGVHLLWTFLATGSSRSGHRHPRCGCIRGQVVPTDPPLRSLVRWRSTPGSTEFLILGLIQTPGPTLPLCKELRAPGLVFSDMFRQLTCFYLFITLMTLHRVSVETAVNHGMPICSRMWQGGRQNRHLTRRCGHRRRENKPGALPTVR
jgi:hypothetical protein